MALTVNRGRSRWFMSGGPPSRTRRVRAAPAATSLPSRSSRVFRRAKAVSGQRASHGRGRPVAIDPVAVCAGVGDLIGDVTHRGLIPGLRRSVGCASDLDEALYVLLPVGAIDGNRLAVLAPAP